MEILVPDEFKYLYARNDERPVVKIPDPVLRQPALEVTKLTKKVGFVIDDMIRIMRQANGVGIAAPQLGISQRIVIIAPEDSRPMALINPKIVKAEGEGVYEEGCLSIPGLYGDVKRHSYVEVEAYDRKGRAITIELDGRSADIAQHELDHLDGILFIDKVDPTTLHWMHPDGDPGIVE